MVCRLDKTNIKGSFAVLHRMADRYKTRMVGPGIMASYEIGLLSYD